MARYKPKRLSTAPSTPHPRRPKHIGGAQTRHRLLRRLPVVRLLLLVAALTAAAMLGGTAARYWKNWSDNTLVTAENFYFTSNKLGDRQTLYPLTPDEDGNATFAFTLQNYVVEDYPTKKAISYACAVTDASGSPVELQWKSGGADDDGVLPGGTATRKTLSCVIPASAFASAGGDGELTVTVTSTKPYAKTLAAKVALSAGSGGVVLEVTEPSGNSGAVAVTLYNPGSQPRTGTLRLADLKDREELVLAPDPTGEAVPGKDGKLTVPAQSAVSVVFLKKNVENHFDETKFVFEISN